MPKTPDGKFIPLWAKEEIDRKAQKIAELMRDVAELKAIVAGREFPVKYPEIESPYAFIDPHHQNIAVAGRSQNVVRFTTQPELDAYIDVHPADYGSGWFTLMGGTNLEVRPGSGNVLYVRSRHFSYKDGD